MLPYTPSYDYLGILKATSTERDLEDNVAISQATTMASGNIDQLLCALVPWYRKAIEMGSDYMEEYYFTSIFFNPKFRKQKTR